MPTLIQRRRYQADAGGYRVGGVAYATAKSRRFVVIGATRAEYVRIDKRLK